MNTFSRVPPGFRFHPTDEELVDYYLRKKVTSRKIDLDVIKDVDLYKIEPWDLQELCRISTEEQQEWYFFSHKDKKYPTGTRTNRATTAGFWKATGRDKAIYSKHDLIGMRKTLVFYQGRAPNGLKSDWIMHEYRLETDENGPPQEEGWVVCRVFKKRMPTIRRLGDHGSPCWYDDSSPFMPDLESPNSNPNCNLANFRPLPSYGCKKELDLHYQLFSQEQHLSMQQLPLNLDNPNKLLVAPYGLDINQSASSHQPSTSLTQDQNLMNSILFGNDGSNREAGDRDQMTTDWRVLDKFVASQLSQEDVHDEVVPNVVQETAAEDVSMQTSASCEIELWK